MFFIVFPFIAFKFPMLRVTAQTGSGVTGPVVTVAVAAAATIAAAVDQRRAGAVARRHPRHHHELDRSELCVEDNGPERAGQITAELTTDRQ